MSAAKGDTVIEVRVTLERDDFAALVRGREVVVENGRLGEPYRVRIGLQGVSFAGMALEVMSAMREAIGRRPEMRKPPASS